MSTQPVRDGLHPKLCNQILDSGPCYYCGTPWPTEVDHINPWSRGGSDDPGNLVPACYRCNRAKSDQTPAEWQERREQAGWPWPPPSPMTVMSEVTAHLDLETLQELSTDRFALAGFADVIRRARHGVFDPEAEAHEFTLQILLGIGKPVAVEHFLDANSAAMLPEIETALGELTARLQVTDDDAEAGKIMEKISNLRAVRREAKLLRTGGAKK